MKKITFIIGSMSLLLFTTSNVDAAVRDKDNTKTATFELTANPDGLDVEAANLQFGQHMILNQSIEAKAINDTSVSVHDHSGSRKGWTLELEMSKFTSGGDTAHGVQLFFPNVTPTTTTTVAAGSPPATFGTSNSFLDSTTGLIVNDDSIPVTLAGAQVGKGYGDWELPYKHSNNQRVQIKVPIGQKIGDYSSTLTYSLTDAPTP